MRLEEEEEVAGQKGHLLWGNLSLLGLDECEPQLCL